MSNLRVESVTVVDSSNLIASFTEKLTNNLDVSNIQILSQTLNVPDSKALKVQVVNNVLKIYCQPLTPYAAYDIVFRSTSNHPFQSLNGEFKLLEDNVGNLKIILGPEEPDNIIRTYLVNFLRENIYNVEDPTTAVYKVIGSFVNSISKSLYDVRQVKNENYLSNTIEDEQKTRGGGPFDRLDQEGAYEIIRVGLTPSGNKVSGFYSVDTFPFYPFTLQSTQVTRELLTPDSVDVDGKFNINSLILNLNSSPVIKLTKLTFILSSLPSIYEYDIQTLGYQIKENKYDQDFGFKYLLLEDNQIKLNEQILQDPSFKLDAIVRIECSYQYKDVGKIIYSDSLRVEEVLTSSRETLPSIINIFNLKHAPIVDLNNDVPQLGGVTFTDPNSINVNAKHPAFLYESPFRLEALPSFPGAYSVDYTTGRVYVYGADGSKSGTGASPPVATYNYRFSYQDEVDYVYDSDTKDLVSLPKGNLRDNSALINFSYEKVLIPNKDYVAEVHNESLQERVENRLLNLGTIQTTNSPVTNVFRIYNETSGELYSINRWNDNKVYFDYNIAPRIDDETSERVTFEAVLNEFLFVNSSSINQSSLNIFKILLNNNSLIASTEDCIGSSINSSASFSNKSIFQKEKYFQKDSNIQINLNNLNNIGEYCIDYVNGIVYCAVSANQNNDIGTISYRKNNIITAKKHIISVNDIYYQVNPLNPKNKSFTYLSFGDNNIFPENLQDSDELYYNNEQTKPYQINNGVIGYFDQLSFYGKVSEQIKYVRGVFEYQDLVNNLNPINFSNFSSFSGNTITVSPIPQSLITQVNDDGVNLYIPLPENTSYLSPNISYDISIIRNSDGKQLWDSGGQIVTGNLAKLILSGVNSPAAGQIVNLSYTVSINDLSRVVVDYNKGDLYADYTYLLDEIVISYEYGDNVIDFRQSNAVSENTTYYVSYRVGALRDALLKNFGSLLLIPELNVFNVDLDRERYRDALTGALSSFLKGPTISGIKNLVNKITHIDPQIIESVFNSWSLGSSLLYPNQITTEGNFQLIPVKFGNGALIDSPSQRISLPRSSNLSINQGTFETWILPQWDGIDNNAKLTFKILKDNSPVAQNSIFIGDREHHPLLINNSFTIDKNSNSSGIPQKNKNGVFIYYAPDISGLFNRWYVDIIDNTGNGQKYSVQINSDGNFYDVKSASSGADITTTTTNNKVAIKINNLKDQSQIFTFISDHEYYILDSGEKEKNRLSIYKDIAGYLNFKIIDKFKTVYVVSADVSNWKKNEKHFIGASWKLNSGNHRDEMHLFIDGFEVPNIIKYGQKLLPFPHEKFRTVNPETLVGSSDKDIVGSDDLATSAGSNVVNSSINFGNYNINIGDLIYIEDGLFNQSGYTIDAINGNDLTLDQPMPVTLSNLKFSVNKASYTLKLDANVYPSVAVSTLSVIYENNDLSTSLSNNVVTSASSNFTQIKPGYLLRILDGGFELIYNILNVNGQQLTLDQKMPVTLSGLTFYIYSNIEKEIPGVKALRPSYQLSSDNLFNATLTITNDVLAKDLVLLNTFGLNHRKIKQLHYVWGNQIENVIPTRLPPPVSLNDVKITRVISSNSVVNSHNSTVISGILHYLSTDNPPSNSEKGRTLSATISGTNNVDFSTPVQIILGGYDYDYNIISETIYFDDYGKLDFSNKFITVNHIQVICKPFNLLKDCLAFEIKEKYPITYAEDSSLVPLIRYSYQMSTGQTLRKTGENIVTDDNNFFSSLDKDNILIVQQPLAAAGIYRISDVSQDHKSLILDLSIPLGDFTDGYYKVLNVTDYRTGFQNGFFVLEQTQFVGEPYFLNVGYYEFEYSTYTTIKFDPLANEEIYLGCDILKSHQSNAALDQVKIYSIQLSDTRVGQVIPSNQRSITKDYNSLIPLRSDINTLTLIDFNFYPFVNSASFYVKNIGGNFIQSDVSINSNFQNSISLVNNPVILDNYGVLDTKKDGTIEFWVNPLYDSAKDPNYRYYFDAYGAKVVETVSLNNSEIKLSEPVSNIISVTLKNGDPNINYFAGGKLEIGLDNAIAEVTTSNNNSSVSVKNQILQVISVVVVGDLSRVNYFENGAVSLDKKTIYLGKPLPLNNANLIVTYKPINGSNNILNYQTIYLNKKLPKDNTPVIVKFIPKGFNGDRLSIYKDPGGYLNFDVTASGKNYNITSPIYWSRDTWHRVKVSFKFNSQVNSDEIRMFVDGYERSSLLINGQVNFGAFSDLGAGTAGISIGNQNISFKDTINQVYLGADYSLNSEADCLIDNLRISNISRPIYSPYGEPLDPNYSSNLEVAFPVTTDLYTTYLLNFDSSATLNEDFAFIVANQGSAFDFTVNIFDSFGIVSSSDTVKQILEKLIYMLKPANSKAYLQYYQ